MTAVYYVDGRFVSAADACIPVDDLALLRGLAVFDFLRTYRSKPYGLLSHLGRLRASAERIGIDLPWSRESLAGIVQSTLDRNDNAESNVRIIVTAGSSTDFMNPQGKPRLIVMVTPLPVMPSWWYEKGVGIVTVRLERPMTGAKRIDYVEARMALEAAHRQSAVEAVYMDRNDRVYEGTTSNLFLIRNGALVTPGRGILPGITRQTILDVAKIGMPVEVQDISIAELLQADEVFISGTNKGIVPVVSVDGHPIASGKPGKLTRNLSDAFNAWVQQNAEPPSFEGSIQTDLEPPTCERSASQASNNSTS
jgi:branched-chain amino acid aminotransferase